MKNFTLAIAVLLVMASFTTNLTNSSSAVLSDYEGTLLKSAPVLENNDGDVKVTFTVDQNVLVSSALIGESNEIFLDLIFEPLYFLKLGPIFVGPTLCQFTIYSDFI